MKWFFDTNVLVAAFIQEHEFHAKALPLVEAVQKGRHEGYVSAHSLLETYAVLTRLPRSPRIVPAQAALLIQENVLKHFTSVALSGEAYGRLVVQLGAGGIAGGQAYDALHLECAAQCKATRIYTFNPRHFAAIAPELAERIMTP
jgi:predicted nucleic acid-binding protein